jgi:hypothetical protein
MALKVILRNRAGEDLLSQNLSSDTAMYPEVIVWGDDNFILRRVMPDKSSAIYFEARTQKIEKP